MCGFLSFCLPQVQDISFLKLGEISVHVQVDSCCRVHQIKNFMSLTSVQCNRTYFVSQQHCKNQNHTSNRRSMRTLHHHNHCQSKRTICPRKGCECATTSCPNFLCPSPDIDLTACAVSVPNRPTVWWKEPAADRRPAVFAYCPAAPPSRPGPRSPFHTFLYNCVFVSKYNSEQSPFLIPSRCICDPV